jgi:hypothetical protein
MTLCRYLLSILSLVLFSISSHSHSPLSMSLSVSLSLFLCLLVRTGGMNRVPWLRINEILLLVFGHVTNYFFHMRKRVDYTYQIFRNILDKDTKEKERKPDYSKGLTLRSRYNQLSVGNRALSLVLRKSWHHRHRPPRARTWVNEK